MVLEVVVTDVVEPDEVLLVLAEIVDIVLDWAIVVELEEVPPMIDIVGTVVCWVEVTGAVADAGTIVGVVVDTEVVLVVVEPVKRCEKKLAIPWKKLVIELKIPR